MATETNYKLIDEKWLEDKINLYDGQSPEERALNLAYSVVKAQLKPLDTLSKSQPVVSNDDEDYPTYEQSGGNKQWEEMTELEKAYYNIRKLKNALAVNKNTIQRLRDTSQPVSTSEIEREFTNETINPVGQPIPATLDEQDELIEFLEGLQVQPYPEDLFLPISKKELAGIHEMLKEKFDMPLDRLTGHIGRLLRKPIIEDATKILSLIKKGSNA